ncbi:MAG: serine/threonine protein kinase [Planctomycetaceae bacterium]|nr:serine/threonine protein kinase [Planctomycetales bacterium]MCB9923087.1 serine/threonine protein kinase [Planctomycetaceae bacterium]
MTVSSSCLLPSEVAALLSDALPRDRRCDVEDHLGDCPNCREAIENAIGPEQWWKRVQVSLSGDDQPRAIDEVGDYPDVSTAAITQLVDLLGPSDDPRMLGRIGAYEVVGLLGQGGMGAVFKALDRSLNRYVAIKIMLPHLAASASARKRFAREGQAIAAVVDDHVMAVHAVDQWRGIPYLVTTYSRGISLQKRLEQEGNLELREILRIGLQTARGLSAAHAQGIVHRDVKPANIFLDTHVERVQLMDFGLAQATDDASLTRSGMLAGTPLYMSPEQARGEQVDHRSDLFSLGGILYTACTGRPAFRAETSYGILRRITDDAPRPIRERNPDIPEWMCQIIDRLLAKDPAERFQSANEVAELFEGCLAHLQQPTQVELPDCAPKSALVAPSECSTSTSRFKRLVRVGVLVMISLAGLTTIAALMMQVTAAPNIAGSWSGEQWPTITLQIMGESDGWYSGDIVDAEGREGTLQLHWTRLQQRYNGDWRLGESQFGEITLRRETSNRLRGAVVLDPTAESDAATARLREFAWHKRPMGIDQDSWKSVQPDTQVTQDQRLRYPLKKRPEHLSPSARFCLLLFGPSAKHHVWLIHDEDKMYVDLNENGDLSEPDERYLEKEEEDFLVPGVTSRGFVVPASLGNTSELRSYFPMRVSWQTSDKRALWIQIPIGDRYWQEAVITGSATDPDHAPILHFDGPLKYFLLDPKSYFTTGRPMSLSIAMGTTSSTGDISYVDFDQPNDDAWQPRLTVRHFPSGTAESQIVEHTELTVAQYGTYMIATLKPTRPMRTGELEIDVRNPANVRFEAERLQCRIPLREPTENRSSLSDHPPRGTPLLDAIREFNERSKSDAIGKDQPPLTDVEVVASIRWALRNPTDQMAEKYIRGLTTVAEHRVLPTGWSIQGGASSFVGNSIQTPSVDLDSNRPEGPRGWYIGLSDRLHDSIESVTRDKVHDVRVRLLLPTTFSPPRRVEGDNPDSTPLAVAIRDFNKRCRTIDGSPQPPLTEDEVVAAIEYWSSRREKVPVTNLDFATFQRIATTRTLPKNTQLDLITHFLPGDGNRYSIWMVRIRVPTSDGGNYAFTVRKQFISLTKVGGVDIQWGPPDENGLRLGVRLSPTNETYRIGQTIEAEFFYHADGETALLSVDPGERLYSGVEAYTSSGQPLKVLALEYPRTIDVFDEYGLGELPVSLGTGMIRIADPESYEVERAEMESRDKGVPRETVIFAAAGQSCRVRFVLPNHASRRTDVLRTGEVAFSIERRLEGVAAGQGQASSGSEAQLLDNATTIQNTPNQLTVDVKIATPVSATLTPIGPSAQEQHSIPSRVSVTKSRTWRALLSDIPGFDALELSLSLELPPDSPDLLGNPTIPVKITRDDIERVLSGNLVTKMISNSNPVAGDGVTPPTDLDELARNRDDSARVIVRLGNRLHYEQLETETATKAEVKFIGPLNATLRAIDASEDSTLRIPVRVDTPIGETWRATLSNIRGYANTELLMTIDIDKATERTRTYLENMVVPVQIEADDVEMALRGHHATNVILYSPGSNQVTSKLIDDASKLSGSLDNGFARLAVVRLVQQNSQRDNNQSTAIPTHNLVLPSGEQ